MSSPSPPPFNLSQHQGLFQLSWIFKSSGQSIGASVSVSVLPMNIQDWFPLGWTGWMASFNFLAAVTISSDFGGKGKKIFHCFHCFPLHMSQSDGTRCHGLSFLISGFKSAFHSPLSPSSRSSLVPLYFLLKGLWHLYIWGFDISPGNLDSS